MLITKGRYIKNTLGENNYVVLVLDDKGWMDGVVFLSGICNIIPVLMVTLLNISYSLSSREWAGVCVYARFYA